MDGDTGTRENTDGLEDFEEVEVVAVVWVKPPVSHGSEPVPKVQPLRFSRRVRYTSPHRTSVLQEHRIERIVSTWKSFEGVYPLYHFGVEDDSARPST